MQLRLQYNDQSNSEWLGVAMESILASDGSLCVFDLSRGESGLWLYSGNGDPGYVWVADVEFVFVRSRK